MARKRAYTSIAHFERPFDSASDLAKAMLACQDQTHAKILVARVQASSELACKLSLHSFALLALIPALASLWTATEEELDREEAEEAPKYSERSATAKQLSENGPVESVAYHLESVREAVRRIGESSVRYAAAAARLFVDGHYREYEPLFGTSWGPWIVENAAKLERAFGADDPLKAIANYYRHWFHYHQNVNPWCGLLPNGLVDAIWHELWQVGQPERFGDLGHTLARAMSKSELLADCPPIKESLANYDPVVSGCTKYIVGWLVADSLAREFQGSEIDEVTIQRTPADAKRGTLLECIGLSENGDDGALPWLSIFSGALSGTTDDIDPELVRRNVNSLTITARNDPAVTGLIEIDGFRNWADTANLGEELEHLKLLIRTASLEWTRDESDFLLFADLLTQGKYKIADAIIAASILFAATNDGDEFPVFDYVQKIAKLPSGERPYVERMLAALDNGDWGNRGVNAKAAFSRCIRVTIWREFPLPVMESYPPRVQNYIKAAHSRLLDARGGDMGAAAGHCVLELAKAVEHILKSGLERIDWSQRTRERLRKRPLGDIWRFLEEQFWSQNDSEEGRAIRESWYRKLAEDRRISIQIRRLIDVRNKSAHDRTTEVELQEADALWLTWVREGQLEYLLAAIDGSRP